jgi:hypothetical protein
MLRPPAALISVGKWWTDWGWLPARRKPLLDRQKTRTIQHDDNRSDSADADQLERGRSISCIDCRRNGDEDDTTVIINRQVVDIRAMRAQSADSFETNRILLTPDTALSTSCQDSDEEQQIDAIVTNEFNIIKLVSQWRSIQMSQNCSQPMST